MPEVSNRVGSGRDLSGRDDSSECIQGYSAMIYRKIDYDLTPALFVAHLICRDVCGCGASHVKEETPIGREYNVDLKSVRWVRYECAGCGRTSDLRVIDVYPDDSSLQYKPEWFFLDALDIGESFLGPPKPREWEPVKDNKVRSPHDVGRRVVN